MRDVQMTQEIAFSPRVLFVGDYWPGATYEFRELPKKSGNDGIGATVKQKPSLESMVEVLPSYNPHVIILDPYAINTGNVNDSFNSAQYTALLSYYRSTPQPEPLRSLAQAVQKGTQTIFWMPGCYEQEIINELDKHSITPLVINGSRFGNRFLEIYIPACYAEYKHNDGTATLLDFVTSVLPLTNEDREFLQKYSEIPFSPTALTPTERSLYAGYVRAHFRSRNPTRDKKKHLELLRKTLKNFTPSNLYTNIRQESLNRFCTDGIENLGNLRKRTSKNSPLAIPY